MAEKFFLASTLLVPAPGKTQGFSFLWKSVLRSDREVVNVIAFNTTSKSEFKSLLEKDLAELQAQDIKDTNTENSISFIQDILKMIGVTGFDHQVPEELLKAAASSIGERLERDNVIYLSGVSRIEQC